MKLFAISDVHLGYRENREAFARVPPHRDDWLILAGDLGETEPTLRFALDVAVERFARIIWTPGNHELWTVPGDGDLRGVRRYEHLVAVCREYGVCTPEDPYPEWEGEGGPHTVAPVFLLYDYSFRPDDVPFEEAVPWALASGVLCADEKYIDPTPYASRQAWCEARSKLTEDRLARLPRERPIVLVNHFPLRRDLVRLGPIPRFSIWCGTRRTEDWHTRYNVRVVVSGHLHVRATDWRDGVRFEEVSLGYPRQWDQARGVEPYLREILPGPSGGP